MAWGTRSLKWSQNIQNKIEYAALTGARVARERVDSLDIQDAVDLQEEEAV